MTVNKTDNIITENDIDPATGCVRGIKPDVLNYDDMRKMVPFFNGKPKLVNKLLRWFGLEEVNQIHRRNGHDIGVKFATNLVEEEFKFKLTIENEDILKSIGNQPFITVSNHPFGAMDGIILLHLVGKYHPDYMVMVNMFLNHIEAMRPAFIAVDPNHSDDPEKRNATMAGIRQAMKHVKSGHPLGFFPAGAVSKINNHLRIRDRQWQPSVIRLIQQLKVPVIPIYFHGHNSTFFNILGLIDWRLRTLRLPTEVLRRRGKAVKVTVGNPISVEEQQQYPTTEAFGEFLKSSTYALAKS